MSDINNRIAKLPNNKSNNKSTNKVANSKKAQKYHKTNKYQKVN